MAHEKKFLLPVLIVALGYFVDVYDLILFSVLRVASLKALAVPNDQLLSLGVYLLNAQLLGMLFGGFLWGILADKYGRSSMLLGSIALYSLANIANAFVFSIPQYAICRFIAGIGLAGELGAGITLISEMLPKNSRTIGTMAVTAMGMLGGLAATLFGEMLPWDQAYILGGSLGLTLLFLRFQMRESPLFHKEGAKAVRLGDMRLLLESRQRLLRYIACILAGTPVWLLMGVVATFSPEIGEALHVQQPVSAGRFLLFVYIGITIGSVISGLASHYWQRYKQVIIAFLIIFFITLTALLLSSEITPTAFYLFATALGTTTGFWPLILANAAGQFGTNLRATVTTTIPNFVRASALPMTVSFLWLKEMGGIVYATGILGFSTIAIAMLSICYLKESCTRDLDFLET